MIKDPFLFDLVQNELIDEYGINTVRKGGLKAYTTIDPDLQSKAEYAVENYCYVCYPEGGPAAGLASVNPKNGAIVALASTEGFADENQFNYAWQAHRQPGSSFKTFVLTTAVKQGIDPGQHLLRRHLAEDPGDPRRRHLDGQQLRGRGGRHDDLESATWHSVNVVFAQLDLDVGPENVTETAQEMGIESPLQSVPAEGIGGLGIGVTPLEMADAYATLASGGIHHDPTAVSKVEFPDGKVDEFENDSGERVLTPGQAYEVTRILEGVITQGTGAGYTSMGCTAAAGKTGTSEELSDAWFVGYTPLFSTAVWVGHPTSREYTGFGGPTAGPIWANYMSEASRRRMPGIRSPEPCPNSTASTANTPPLPAPVSYEEEETYEGEEEETRRDTKGKGKGGDEGGEENTPEPEPTPESTPDAYAHSIADALAPGRRRHQPRLIRTLLPDQLDPVAVGVSDEADAVALGAAAGAVGGLFGLDA